MREGAQRQGCSLSALLAQCESVRPTRAVIAVGGKARRVLALATRFAGTSVRVTLPIRERETGQVQAMYDHLMGIGEGKPQ